MTLKKRLGVCVFLILAGFFLPSAAFSETVLPDKLDADTELSFKKGMLAAEQGALDLALNYFKEVQGKAPLYPPVLFNLGLAHSQAGHELTAIGWLRAYLVSNAAPEDKKAVEEELLKLEVSVEAKATDIMKQAVELAGLLPEGEGTYANPRKDALKYVYWSYVRTGNVEEAIRFGLQRGIIPSDSTQDTLMNLVSLVGEAVDRGDIREAEKYAAKITADPWQTEAVLKLSKYYARVMDVEKLGALRPKLKYPLKKYDFADTLATLYKNGAAELANSYAELGDAETLADVIFQMSLAKREEEVRPLLTHAEHRLPEPVDSSAVTSVARAAIILRDFKTLERMIAKLEAYMQERNDQGDTWRAFLAGYYAYLGNNKKAGQIFALIAPDDPNNFFLRDRSRAALEIMEAAMIRDDYKLFLEYMPHSRAGFLGSELAKMFADFAWSKFQAGKTKEAQKIMADCPDGQSLEGWKNKDPEFHRDVMYQNLTYYAAKAGQLDQAYEFRNRITLAGQALQVAKTIGEALIENEDFEGAQTYYADQKEDRPITLIELALKKEAVEEASRLFNEILAVDLKKNEYWRLDELISLAQKLNAQDELAELKHLKAVVAWIEFAKKMEADTTFTPEQTYQSAKQALPAEAPAALARLAEDYWKRLREIKFLQRA